MLCEPVFVAAGEFGVVPKRTRDMVASISCTIFGQPDAEHLRNQFDGVASMLEPSHPKVSHVLNDAMEDLLAFTGNADLRWPRVADPKWPHPLEFVG